MNWYSMIERYYNRGFWTKDMVKVAVEANKITPNQYQIITGEEYAA